MSCEDVATANEALVSTGYVPQCAPSLCQVGGENGIEQKADVTEKAANIFFCFFGKICPQRSARLY